jgi:hypothetical protein
MPLSLAEIAEAVDELRQEDPDDWGLKSAELGDELDSLMWHPTELVEIATAIAARAEQLGCTRLIGASPLGNRLATAAVAIANNGLVGAEGSPAGDRVCVVDGLVATGWNIRHTVAAVQAQGAASVVAVGVVRGLRTEIEGLEAVFLLGE